MDKTEDVQTITIAEGETREVIIESSGKFAIELTGPGAHADIFGAFELSEKQEVKIELTVLHCAPHTSAQTTLKGVVRDKAYLRFFGRIKILPNCPDVQSFLEERVLLLSDTAKAEAIPELEILSDDVKCSHLASISNLPEVHLFYLQSRGLSHAKAEALIVQGFLSR